MVQRGGKPPGGDRRRWRGRRGEGEKEVRNNGALGRRETTVPEEVHGEVAGEKGAVMVTKSNGFRFDEVERAWGGGEGGSGKESEKRKEEVEERRHLGVGWGRVSEF